MNIRTRILIVLLILMSSNSFAAKDCDYYKDRIQHYENMRRLGGEAKQMNYWRHMLDEAEDSRARCKKNDDPGIAVATASPTPEKMIRADRWQTRRIETDDQALKQLLSTCNFWINQTNATPTQDNANFRNSACSAVDNYSPSDSTSHPATPQYTRTLKDCMKPNNLLDNDVNECLKGQKEPTWKH